MEKIPRSVFPRPPFLETQAKAGDRWQERDSVSPVGMILRKFSNLIVLDSPCAFDVLNSQKVWM